MGPDEDGRWVRVIRNDALSWQRSCPIGQRGEQWVREKFTPNQGLRRGKFAGFDRALPQSNECGTRLRLETKFLRVKTPVTIRSRFGDWHVCWLGGWTRQRLAYIVMVVRIL